ncbi:MAG TPA: metalloregulator ArsR/SmtB family transcription factor [Polyangia bacterium]|nr:metalloregulator ArsR/SmtB family transcription factor [Polyangia bacterium]
MLAAAPSARADLFRVLGDEDRLRLLALCAAEELTVGELATLTRESQPQVTRKSQPLREAGLLVARKDGTRTLLRAEPEAAADPVVRAALEAGRALCEKDGSLAEVPALVAQREETSRRLFARDEGAAGPAVQTPADGAPLLAMLPMLAPLLPGRALAVDVGAGEGALLALLSPLYERVVAIDRSAARLARCAERVSALGLPNVRLREGAVEDAGIVEEIARAGGADLVVVSRVLHFVARPQDVLAAAARLARAGGHVIVVDHVPHEDESLRERGHVWLGFEPAKLRAWLEAAGLEDAQASPLRSAEQPPLQIAVGRAPGRPLN